MAARLHGPLERQVPRRPPLRLLLLLRQPGRGKVGRALQAHLSRLPRRRPRAPAAPRATLLHRALSPREAAAEAALGGEAGRGDGPPGLGQPRHPVPLPLQDLRLGRPARGGAEVHVVSEGWRAGLRA